MREIWKGGGRLGGLAWLAILLFGQSCLAAQPVASPSAAAQGAPLPIEALAALPSLSDPALSPDGWRIAARIRVEGKSRIAVWDLRHREAPPRMLAHDNYELRWLRWAGPNRILLGVGMTALYSGLTLPVTRIIAMDVSNSNTWSVRMLNTGRGLVADTVIHTDPDGRYILVSSQPSLDQYPAVYRTELATGESEVVQRPQTGVWRWFADEQGVVRLGIDYGDRRIRFYYRNAAGEALRRIDTRRYPQDDSMIDAVRFVGNR